MTDSQNEHREHRKRHYATLTYECDDCGFLIEGHSGDPQEAPWLYCPDCDGQMNLSVEQ